MHSKYIATILQGCLWALVGATPTAHDKFTLTAPNGIAFSEFRGYETWQSLAPSRTDDGLKMMTANAVAIDAYKEGIPGSGRPFPDGSMIAKIEWATKENPASPYSVQVPDTLKSVAFMVKNSHRFPETDGWGYAQFMFDAASDTFKPFGSNSSFGKVCHQCHTAVKARDFVFTGYPGR